MKYIFKILVLFNIMALVSCDEKEYGPIEIDEQAPGKVEILETISVPGGFKVTYKLPADKDLLYVKAVYSLKDGEESEVKVSYFENEMEIFGFGDTSERTVNIYAVDRSENISEPASFAASPLEPPVTTIQNTMTITADFGGAKFTWVNETEAPIAILIFAEDSLGRMENVKTVYTSQKESKFSIRGYKSEPTRFAAIIRDRWDNLSDSIVPAGDGTVIPLFEERLDKTKFKKIIFQNDTNWDAWEGDWYNCFDDDMKTIVHTQGDHPSPQIMSIDFGVKVKLSRFTVYQRQSHGPAYHAYTHGNPKQYDVYGSLTNPGDDGNLDDWIFLRECTSIKPSGLPIGQNTDEDIAHIEAGDEYTFDEPIEIRYFRFAVNETWDGAGYIDFSEMTFWGEVTEEL